MIIGTPLSKLITAAKSGDAIKLAPGDYGDLVLSKPLTITGPREAVFSSVVVKASGVILEGFSVRLPITGKTSSASSAVKVTGAGVTLRDLAVECGVSPANPTGSSAVEGQLIGRCITLSQCDGALVEGCDLSNAHRGIVVEAGRKVTLRGNFVHDIRTSPIVGAGCDDLTISHNRLMGSTPHGWGNGNLDHADFIHVWITDTQTADTFRLQVVQNVLEQGNGTAVLGIYLDNNRLPYGFSDALVSGNRICNGNGQGLAFECVAGVCVGNVLLPSPGTVAKKSPMLIIRRKHPTLPLEVRGNVLPYSSALADYPGNTILTPATIAALISTADL